MMDNQKPKPELRYLVNLAHIWNLNIKESFINNAIYSKNLFFFLICKVNKIFKICATQYTEVLEVHFLKINALYLALSSAEVATKLPLEKPYAVKVLAKIHCKKTEKRYETHPELLALGWTNSSSTPEWKYYNSNNRHHFMNN